MLFSMDEFLGPHADGSYTRVNPLAPRRPPLRVSPGDYGVPSFFKIKPEELSPPQLFQHWLSTTGISNKIDKPTQAPDLSTQIGKRPLVIEPITPMKLELPETQIEMIGKNIGDEIRALAKSMHITVFNFTAGAYGNESRPVGKTHYVRAKIYVESKGNNHDYRKLIVQQYLCEKAKGLLMMPTTDKVEFEIAYEKADFK